LQASAFNCTDCKEKKRNKRNCNNRQNRRESITHRDEWYLWPESLKPVQKLGDLKLWECPLTAISRRTWEILALVNETTNIDAEVLHLPFNGAWLDQPKWYRQAVSIVKVERAKHRQKEAAKQTASMKKGK
jgi:hypothetical protein